MSIPGDVVALECDIDATTPPQTEIAVAIRFGDSPSDLGEWVSLEPGRRTTVIERSPVYLQYRLELGTTDATVAPTVRAIEIRWTGDLSVRESPGRRITP